MFMATISVKFDNIFNYIIKLIKSGFNYIISIIKWDNIFNNIISNIKLIKSAFYREKLHLGDNLDPNPKKLSKDDKPLLTLFSKKEDGPNSGDDSDDPSKKKDIKGKGKMDAKSNDPGDSPRGVKRNRSTSTSSNNSSDGFESYNPGDFDQPGPDEPGPSNSSRYDNGGDHPDKVKTLIKIADRLTVLGESIDELEEKNPKTNKSVIERLIREREDLKREFDLLKGLDKQANRYYRHNKEMQHRIGDNTTISVKGGKDANSDIGSVVFKYSEGDFTPSLRQASLDESNNDSSNNDESNNDSSNNDSSNNDSSNKDSSKK